MSNRTTIPKVSEQTTQRVGWFLLLMLTLLLAACRNSDDPVTPVGEPADRARLNVVGAGLFRVDARTLATMGWTADDPLTLTMAGETVPFQRVENSLFFYLPEGSQETDYSPENALWFSYGTDGVGTAGASSETPIEQLTAIKRLTGHEEYKPTFDDNPWFWKRLINSEPFEQTIATPGRQAGDVMIDIKLAGLTVTDHRVSVLIGENTVGTLDWTGQERTETTIVYELEAGDNLSFSLTVPDTYGPADQSLIDEIVVSYPSAPVASDALFIGQSEQSGAVQFEGISDPIAWQVGETLVPLAVSDATVSLPANASIVVASRQSAQPVSELFTPTEAISTDGADYVAVVVPSLQQAVQPLLDFHQSQGRSTLLLDPQQLYDHYSDGIVDPLAIRAMLSDAQLSWKTVPTWLLLVGDSTYDPYGYKSEVPESYLPSPFVMTVFGGLTVSDNVIGDIDEDGYPDVAVGRLPARTAEQLTQYITKRIAYSEETDSGDWTNRVVLAADGQEELFRNNSEMMREIVPAYMSSDTLYPEAESDAETMVLPELDKGALIVNYIGHGSVEQWGKDKLLTSQHAVELSNGEKLPFFINMTCLAGLFSHPDQQSLGESLLWAENGGAIATVAPTSLTLPTGQTTLNSELLRSLIEDHTITVGEALDQAKRLVPLSSEHDHDVVATFNLLGDPAIQLLKPNGEGQTVQR